MSDIGWRNIFYMLVHFLLPRLVAVPIALVLPVSLFSVTFPEVICTNCEDSSGDGIAFRRNAVPEACTGRSGLEDFSPSLMIARPTGRY